jgi:hypothetical protein
MPPSTAKEFLFWRTPTPTTTATAVAKTCNTEVCNTNRISSQDKYDREFPPCNTGPSSFPATAKGEFTPTTSTRKSNPGTARATRFSKHSGRIICITYGFTTTT